MSDTSEKTNLPDPQDKNKEQVDEGKQIEESTQIQQTHKSPDIDDSVETIDIWKSQRTRTLTENGKVLQDAKLNNVRRDFECTYTRWKYHINGLKRSIKHKEAPEFISEVVTTLTAHHVDVNVIYDRNRAIAVPDFEIRRKITHVMPLPRLQMKRLSASLMLLVIQKTYHGLRLTQCLVAQSLPSLLCNPILLPSFPIGPLSSKHRKGSKRQPKWQLLKRCLKS